MLLVKFFVEFIHFLTGLPKGAFSSSSDFVDPSTPTFNAMDGRAEQARAFESMEKRIKRPRTDAIAVVLQLLHHGKSEDRLMHRVQEHVNANQSIEELASLICHGDQYTLSEGLSA